MAKGLILASGIILLVFGVIALLFILFMLPYFDEYLDAGPYTSLSVRLLMIPILSLTVSTLAIGILLLIEGARSGKEF